MPYLLEPPPLNPLTRLLAGILAVLALVGAFVFGLFVIAMVVGIGILAWLAFWLRMVWLRRRLAKAGSRPDAGSGRDSGKVIEAEYTVVSSKKDD